MIQTFPIYCQNLVKILSKFFTNFHHNAFCDPLHRNVLSSRYSFTSALRITSCFTFVLSTSIGAWFLHKNWHYYVMTMFRKVHYRDPHLHPEHCLNFLFNKDISVHFLGGGETFLITFQ